MSNTRYKEINDIRIGYNYPLQQYYITNKETTTYRTTIEDIRDVLDTLDITTTDITDTELNIFKNNYETLFNTYYTWEDTGLYIKALQFNEWHDYPLIIDCEKATLYIKNSTTIFNINTNESLRLVITPTLCNFYKDTLGLEIDTNVMYSYCLLLLSYYSPSRKDVQLLYNPKCVNIIEQKEEDDETTDYYYTNEFKAVSFDSKAPSTYTCYNNPLNQFNYTPISNIIALADNKITLTESIDTDTYPIRKGSKLQVQGITETVDNSTYTADGLYTVESIEDSIVTVSETFPITYSYPLYTCSAIASQYAITSMSRDNNTITLEEAPNKILVGDKVIIQDAIIPDEWGNISLNGEYTVSSITQKGIKSSYSISSLVQNTGNTITLTLSSSIPSLSIGDTLTLEYTLSYTTVEGTNNTESTSSNSISEIVTDTTVTESTTSTISSSIQGSRIVTNYQSYTISCTVESISSNTVTLQGSIRGITLPNATLIEGIAIHESFTNEIIVEEQVLTNFEGNAILYKPVFIGEIADINKEDRIIIFLAETEYNLENKQVMCYNEGIQNIEILTIQEQPNRKSIVVEEEDITLPIEEYPQLQYPIPSEATSIVVNTSDNEEIFPIGTFIENDFEGVQEYTELLKGNTIPSEAIKNNLYNKVASSMSITIHVWGGSDYPAIIQCSKGVIYKKEYGDTQ